MAVTEHEVFGRPFSTDPSRWRDRSTSGRKVPTEVLVLGMPRTGTASMVQALKILGYHDIHHMAACISEPLQNELWHQAVDAKWFGKRKPFERKEWDVLLGGCMAVTDFPSSAFAEDLIMAYPEAKVILNTRPVDAWYRSANETCGEVLRDPSLRMFALAGDPFCSRWTPMVRALWSGFFGIPDGPFGFGGDLMNEDILKRRYVEHYEMVGRLVPKERLYEKDITEGWVGMCEFLGKPIPAVPYPRMNDREEFSRSMGVMVQAGVARLRRLSLKVVGSVFGLVAAVWLLKRLL
ncbi:hypothetical protein LTR85_009608 [Meristemomyces frigidus]|nr:hypothetical protein LTR85_009608 [Meristemomyces frigidus]